MSTQNIVSIVDEGAESKAIGEIAGAFAGMEIAEAVNQAAGNAVLVTFKVHGGGMRIYRYTGDDAVAIRNGADPAGFSGERVS
jgi:hypothetical protein